jgi:hypothetical protein
MDNGTWRLDKYVTATGARTQVATGFGTSALVSAGSYLYSATPTAVRRITKADGTWTQVAGTNAAGYADGTGAGGWFNAITGLGTDGSNLYVTDSANRRLRKLAPARRCPRPSSPRPPRPNWSTPAR